MKRNAMRTNLLRSIQKSLGRYIAIALIITLGAGIFVGLRMTKSDMVATGQKYTDAQNMFDLRFVCSYGWGQEQLNKLRQLDGVVDAEGVFYTDLIVSMGGDVKESVYRFYTIPAVINRLALLGGRMPSAPNECLIDGYHMDDSILGTTVTVAASNSEDSLEPLCCESFTIVGYVGSPLYMDMTRGTTSVGNGSIANCLYVPEASFDVDYYTELHITIPGDYKIYSDEYNQAMEDSADRLEPAMELLAQERYDYLKQEAEDAYQDGYNEYFDGLMDYYEGYHEAYDELHNAYMELVDAEKAIADAEQQLLDGEQQVADGWIALKEGREQLDQASQQVSSNLYKVNSGLSQIESGLQELNSGISQLESGLAQLDSGIAQIEMLIGILNTGISAAQQALDFAKEFELLNQGLIAQLQAQISSYAAQKAAYEAQLADLRAQRATYNSQLQGLYGTRTELETQKAELEDAKVQLISAQGTINYNREQLDEAEEELKTQEKNIQDGWIELEEGKEELAEGWDSYYEGKEEALEKLQDAHTELRDAREELRDARKTIDEMAENTLHILDRNTNMGYASLDSSSDIVEGVSRVFPAFFLLVAALVCITTMTRMVDEERTQIGTLKALGYSNAAIVSKYMLYAGSSAILGCGLGVFMGSAVFPMILWEAYKIMLFINERIVLTFDIALCLTVIAAYTVVELAVTWYCCHKALEEVPAELIRPKAPASGKPLIFERLRLWNRVSFLNKVTIRNIFRYTQRLAMMLVGIGGCTALLLTGFGLRDSIVNIVDFQYEDVTTYDMEVYFSDGQNIESQSLFREEIAPFAQDVHFYHQSSVEIDFDNQVQEIYMICSDEGIKDFINFQSDGKPQSFPSADEMLLSSGVAEALGIQVGDRVVLRDPNMQILELTVSGIYHNYVYNYVIVSPQTVAAHWESEPEQQMAYVRVYPHMDTHEVSAAIAGMDDVLNVSVSEDLADMVRNMMDALDLVVVVIVFCAALLAATVLYNLTNININERIREIATIKVLGFNAGETAMYIFKENLVLSIMGAAVGLLFGKILLDFVMSQIKLNMVWFLARALPLSYVLSVVMTILMAVIVDFVFYFKLEKINMAEALKSVE